MSSTRIVRWWRAFYAEAEPLHPDDAEQDVTARTRTARCYVWEDGGEAVSLIGARLTGDGYGWIGPVYTPPKRRRQGYAGAGVAAASRRLLDAGAPRCMLFTDLDNPTSNKIYHEVGYRRFADWEDHRLTAVAPRAVIGSGSPRDEVRAFEVRTPSTSSSCVSAGGGDRSCGRFAARLLSRRRRRAPGPGARAACPGTRRRTPRAIAPAMPITTVLVAEAKSA